MKKQLTIATNMENMNISELNYKRSDTFNIMEYTRVMNHIIAKCPIKFVPLLSTDSLEPPPLLCRPPRGCHTGIVTMLTNTIMRLSHEEKVDGRVRLYFETCETVGAIPPYEPFMWWIDKETLNYVWISTHSLNPDKYYVEPIDNPTEFIDLLPNESWLNYGEEYGQFVSM
jgi:hypothetical protein